MKRYRPTKSQKWADQRRNRRIVQEYGLDEARRSGFLDLDPNYKKKIKKQNKINNIPSTNSEPKHMNTIVGEKYLELVEQFIASGGDLNECPFDSTNES